MSLFNKLTKYRACNKFELKKRNISGIIPKTCSHPVTNNKPNVRHRLSPGGRFPPSFIHQVIIITGLNKLQLYVLTLKMALDADRA